MTVDAVKRFVGLLTVLADLIVVGRVLLAVARWSGADRRARVDAFVTASIAPLAIPAALAVSLTTVLGSLYFSEVANYTPCKFCWFQRIGLYPIPILLIAVLMRRDLGGRWYAVTLATLTVPISAYHYLIEWYPNLEAGSCDATAPCTAVWFREFGFMSLAFMAASSALAVISLLTLVRDPVRAEERSSVEEDA